MRKLDSILIALAIVLGFAVHALISRPVTPAHAQEKPVRRFTIQVSPNNNAWVLDTQTGQIGLIDSHPRRYKYVKWNPK